MNNCGLDRIHNPAAVHFVWEGRVTDQIDLPPHRERKTSLPDWAVRAARGLSLMSRRVF